MGRGGAAHRIPRRPVAPHTRQLLHLSASCHSHGPHLRHAQPADSTYLCLSPCHTNTPVHLRRPAWSRHRQRLLHFQKQMPPSPCQHNAQHTFYGTSYDAAKQLVITKRSHTVTTNISAHLANEPSSRTRTTSDNSSFSAAPLEVSASFKFSSAVDTFTAFTSLEHTRIASARVPLLPGLRPNLTQYP